MRARHVGSAAVLGITMAAAILGKFNASLFIIMLIVTALSIPEYRKILLSKLSIVTIIAFGAAFAPTGMWMLAHKSSVIARSGKLQIGASGNLFIDRLNGVGSFIEAAFLFSIVALAVAGIIALIHSKARTSPNKPFTSGEIFMRRLLIIGMGIVLPVSCWPVSAISKTVGCSRFFSFCLQPPLPGLHIIEPEHEHW